MRMIFAVVLLIGVGLAGGAVYLAKDYIGAYQNELARERAQRELIVPTVDIFIASRAFRYGEKITVEDVKAVKWPEEAIPEGAFQSIEALFPEGEEVLRRVTRAMEAGEAILQVKVTEPGQDAGVSSRLSRGMRAFAIKVDVATGVSGFLRPGDRVDVFWTGRSRALAADEGNGEITKLIETAVRLIAIDQTADEDRDSPSIARTVTVEATPRQVAALAQAQTTGRLSLALVGVEDDTVAEDVEIDQASLLGIVIEEEVVVEEVEEEEPEVCTIRTRRGADIVITEIPCTN